MRVIQKNYFYRRTAKKGPARVIFVADYGNRLSSSIAVYENRPLARLAAEMSALW